jgi:hypothetical protein
MAEMAKILTTDAELDAAIRHARAFEKCDPKVLRATYSARTDRLMLHMDNGVTQSIPRKLIQGLSDANSRALSKIELLGGGTGLHWPTLDVSHYVPRLLQGIYGSEKWIVEHRDIAGGLVRRKKKPVKAISMNQEVEWRQLNAGLRLILEETLADAILQLPDRERALLISLYYENKSIQQISSDSGISVSEIINIEKSALIRIWKPLSSILPDWREQVGAVQTSKHQRGVR